MLNNRPSSASAGSELKHFLDLDLGLEGRFPVLKSLYKSL